MILFCFFPVFPGNMQNLTAIESSQCIFCESSLVFVAAFVPYILISVPINGWVLWLMISSPFFWTDRMEVFQFQLVLAEILIAFLEMPMIAFFFLNTNRVSIVIKFAESVIIARNEFQSFVCVERYLAVVRPVQYLRYKPLRYRMSFCCLVWLQIIVIVGVQMHLCSESEISVSLHMMSFVYNFATNTFCCLSVLRALKQPSPGQREKERSSLIKKRAFNIVLIFQVTTFLGYIPLITVLVLKSSIDRNMLCILQPLTYCMMVWFGAIHPILYLRRARKQLVINHLCVNCFLK